MVALNYQTPDRPMQLNQGRFLQNGRCGYVLRPDFMHDDGYDPYDRSTLKSVHPVTLSIKVIAARHLMKSGRGIVSPFVEVEIVGADYDSCKYKTGTIPDNGLNPVWNEAYMFDICNPSVALLRFVVQDEDMFGDPNFLGQVTAAFPLKNEYSEELELASLLVHLEMHATKEEDEAYVCIQRLRDESRELGRALEESERRGDVQQAQALRQQLSTTQEQLRTKREERRTTFTALK
ncbi:hypothetical protein MRX96_034483 [Rhipicephalus microplus]